jgi:hypothetical protein
VSDGRLSVAHLVGGQVDQQSRASACLSQSLPLKVLLLLQGLHELNDVIFGCTSMATLGSSYASNCDLQHLAAWLLL